MAASRLLDDDAVLVSAICSADTTTHQRHLSSSDPIQTVQQKRMFFIQERIAWVQVLEKLIRQWIWSSTHLNPRPPDTTIEEENSRSI